MLTIAGGILLALLILLFLPLMLALIPCVIVATGAGGLALYVATAAGLEAGSAALCGAAAFLVGLCGTWRGLYSD